MNSFFFTSQKFYHTQCDFARGAMKVLAESTCWKVPKSTSSARNKRIRVAFLKEGKGQEVARQLGKCHIHSYRDSPSRHGRPLSCSITGLLTRARALNPPRDDQRAELFARYLRNTFRVTLDPSQIRVKKIRVEEKKWMDHVAAARSENRRGA